MVALPDLAFPNRGPALGSRVVNKAWLLQIGALALVVSGCVDPIVEREWCRQHEGELQQLGRGLGVDYSALNKEAANHVPADVDQQEWEKAYWSFLESNPTWLGLCREANVRRQGAEDWTAPPVPTRTPPGGGAP